MRKQSFVVNHGSYSFDILVCLGFEDTETIRLVEQKSGRKLSEEERNALKMDGRGRTAMLTGGQTVIQVHKGVRGKELNHVLAHEIFHAVEFLFDRIGQKYTLETSEAWAYQIQHITKQIYEKLK